MNFEEWISYIVKTEESSEKIIGCHFGLFKDVSPL